MLRNYYSLYLLVPAIFLISTTCCLGTVNSDGNELEDLWGDNQHSEFDPIESKIGSGSSRGHHVGTKTEKLSVPLGLMSIFGQHSTSTLSTPIAYEESWQGKWFPSAPGKHRKKQLIEMDHSGRVQMGMSSELCDDAKTNLTMDWDMSPVDYTCFHPESRYPIGPILEPKLECEKNIPATYRPDHFCMNQTIAYRENIPSYGDHRPLWPRFGEYTFVPRQRWLHNIEHGAVVFLYHPCAHPMEVTRLKLLLKRCYAKHVITPSALVPHDRPLVLVAWGCRLFMSIVDDDAAKMFIRNKALHGPEGTYTKEGQYDFGLVDFANKTGNAIYDRVTC